MQLKKEILEELGQLSMVIAGIPRQMPYEVPEGYFAAFPDKMLGLLTGPEDTENKVISPEWSKEPVFSVPAGYFEGFAARMMDKIKDDEFSPLLSRIDKKMPYSLPEGYFETLEAATAIKEESLSPLMAGLKSKAVYQVPEGYFESLSEIVSARVQPAEKNVASPARVISMSRRKRSWWQYSAAAVIVGFAFTIGWLRLHTPAGRQGLTGTDVAQGLVKISDQDIQSYLDNQDNHMAQIQQDDAIGKSTASLEFSDNDIKSFLGDISDNELTQYMEEHGGLKDYPTN
jgi:hypothetical protein